MLSAVSHLSLMSELVKREQKNQNSSRRLMVHAAELEFCMLFKRGYGLIGTEFNVQHRKNAGKRIPPEAINMNGMILRFV